MTIPVLWHVDCSASSGQCHFDDVRKITGGMSRMWAELSHFTGDKWNKPPATDQSDYSISLKYGISQVKQRADSSQDLGGEMEFRKFYSILSKLWLPWRAWSSPKGEWLVEPLSSTILSVWNFLLLFHSKFSSRTSMRLGLAKMNHLLGFYWRSARANSPRFPNQKL